MSKQTKSIKFVGLITYYYNYQQIFLSILNHYIY